MRLRVHKYRERISIPGAREKSVEVEHAKCSEHRSYPLQYTVSPSISFPELYIQPIQNIKRTIVHESDSTVMYTVVRSSHPGKAPCKKQYQIRCFTVRTTAILKSIRGKDFTPSLLSKLSCQIFTCERLSYRKASSEKAEFFFCLHRLYCQHGTLYELFWTSLHMLLYLQHVMLTWYH